jgi:UDP-3-O-[3-hydroxymyristoyl] glucosamine N-acyltransferase
MKFTVAQIAALLQGTVNGDGTQEIYRLSKIQEGERGSISFLANPKYEPFIYTTKATAVIVSESFVPKQPLQVTTIVVKDAYTAFTLLLEQYATFLKASKVGVENPCYIDESSKIGQNHYIGAFSYIGKNCIIGDNVKIYPQVHIGDNVKIGSNTILYAGVKINNDTIVGNNCTIQSGAVIGSDGFGFAPQPDGTYKTIPQLGNVVIEDNVDIGANTTIDRATIGSTIIHKGTKIDNLVQIAHNVEIGENTVIASQAGIAGSTKIGKNVMLGGQVGIAGHIEIGNKVMVAAQSGISSNVADEKVLFGAPAFESKEAMKSYLLIRKLPEIYRKIKELEKKS